MTAAQFNLPAETAKLIPPPKMKWAFALEYLRERDTPLRNLNDLAVRSFMPFLEGPGCVIELGAANEIYRDMLPKSQSYELTNLDGEMRHLDMTQMDLPDNSVDAFVSILALEHVFDHQACLRECLRCLKPGGRLILAAPFLCYYHAAPNDFFRFTDTGLDLLLKDFKILKSFSMGNRGLLTAMCYYEHPYMGSKKGPLARAALRVAALPFLANGIAENQHDRVYALTHAYLCEKP